MKKLVALFFIFCVLKPCHAMHTNKQPDEKTRLIPDFSKVRFADLQYVFSDAFSNTSDEQTREMIRKAYRSEILRRGTQRPRQQNVANCLQQFFCLCSCFCK